MHDDGWENHCTEARKVKRFSYHMVPHDGDATGHRHSGGASSVSFEPSTANGQIKLALLQNHKAIASFYRKTTQVQKIGILFRRKVGAKPEKGQVIAMLQYQGVNFLWTFSLNHSLCHRLMGTLKLQKCCTMQTHFHPKWAM